MTRRLPQPPNEWDNKWASRTIDDIEKILDSIERPINSGYQMSNVTVTRTLNANSTTTAELADVLATLIDDLKARGMLGG